MSGNPYIILDYITTGIYFKKMPAHVAHPVHRDLFLEDSFTSVAKSLKLVFDGIMLLLFVYSSV